MEVMSILKYKMNNLELNFILKGFNRLTALV